MAFHIENGEFMSTRLSPRIVENVIAPHNGRAVDIPRNSGVLLCVRSNSPFSIRIGMYTIGTSTPLGDNHVFEVFRGGLPLMHFIAQMIAMIGEPLQEYTVESELIMNPQQRASAIFTPFIFRQPGVGTFRRRGALFVPWGIPIAETPLPTLSPDVDNVSEQLSETCLG